MYHSSKSATTNIRKMKFGIWITFLFTSAWILSCDRINEANLNHPLVYLSHIYVTVDSSTYSDISNSEFIKNSFADIRTETIKADSNNSWTGTYIFGQNTYIEIFNSDYEVFNSGTSGIAFGIEICGGVDSLYKSLTDSGKKYRKKSLRYRRTETGEIPWFYSLYSTKEDSSIIRFSWVQEYVVEYIKHKFPDINTEEINITRRLYNSKRYQNKLLLKDIVEVEFALDEYYYNRLQEELIFYGYKIERIGNKLIGKGPNINIIITDKTKEKSGISRIKFSLNDNQYGNKTINFGSKVKLILNIDKTAEWHFNI